MSKLAAHILNISAIHVTYMYKIVDGEIPDIQADLGSCSPHTQSLEMPFNKATACFRIKKENDELKQPTGVIAIKCFMLYITKTYKYNFDPLIPTFI